jgi:hypothetical protein
MNKLLTVDVDQRYTVETAISHHWFSCR